MTETSPHGDPSISRAGCPDARIASAARHDPSAWERGCATDPVRNDVVVPDLARRLLNTTPRTVLDIGSGTGYITRQLAGEPWAQSIRWVLVDVDERLLTLAARSMAPQWKVSTHLSDLTSPDPPAGAVAGEFAFLAFTLLELSVTLQVGRNLANLVQPGGRLVIYLPDVLCDVIATNSDEMLAAYVGGVAQIVKTDRFTYDREVFHAHRLEQLLRVLLSSGFHLTGLDSLPRSDRNENLYCLELERTVADKCR